MATPAAALQAAARKLKVRGWDKVNNGEIGTKAFQRSTGVIAKKRDPTGAPLLFSDGFWGAISDVLPWRRRCTSWTGA